MRLVWSCILCIDEVCLYSGHDLSISMLKRSIEYVLHLTSSSCPWAGYGECGAHEDSPLRTSEVTCDSAMELENSS